MYLLSVVSCYLTAWAFLQLTGELYLDPFDHVRLQELSVRYVFRRTRNYPFSDNGVLYIINLTYWSSCLLNCQLLLSDDPVRHMRNIVQCVSMVIEFQHLVLRCQMKLPASDMTRQERRVALCFRLFICHRLYLVFFCKKHYVIRLVKHLHIYIQNVYNTTKNSNLFPSKFESFCRVLPLMTCEFSVTCHQYFYL